MKQIIRKLTGIYGPSGHEEMIRSYIKEMIKDHVDDIKIDTLGNLIAYKKGSGKYRGKIMIAAHMDEIGCMVSFVDDKGFARITKLGGVSPLYALGARVLFQNGCVGVVNADKLNGTEELTLEKLFVDVGGIDQEKCPVNIGDAACFFQPMTSSGDFITAKALDDRIGCAVMVQIIKKNLKSKADVYWVFTAQEELGLRGVAGGAYQLNPDVAIALDVTLAGDTPGPRFKSSVTLGKGPAVKLKDSGMLATSWVKDWMIDVAGKNNIPFQREVLLAGTTDACAVQQTRAGIASGCISIPCRYVHSPNEVISYTDVQNSVRLLEKMLEDIQIPEGN